MKINTFDIDGVLFINAEVGGVHPGPNDYIITGRSFEEKAETLSMLCKRGIENRVFLNPLPFAQKTRESSGEHKARTIKRLEAEGFKVVAHFDDDEVQIEIIKRECPHVHVIQLLHNLTEKENVRHTDV